MRRLAARFVRVRVAKMNGTGVDLNLFQFDYYGTWSAFFMNAQGHIYARYGLRKPKKNQDETFMSMRGLKTVMTEVLNAHKKGARLKPLKPLPATPRRPEELPGVPAAMKSGKTCMHCHHVWKYGGRARPRFITWTPEPVLPEAIGLTLDVDLGNVVASVDPAGRAAKAGIRTKDRILSINGVPVYSGADLSWELKMNGKDKPVRVQFARGRIKKEVQL